MFKFKTDSRSIEYCYIETNPRLGMCNWLDTQCGVNNAFNTYAVATGVAPDVNLDWQIDGHTYWNSLLDFYARVNGRQSPRDIVKVYTDIMPRKIDFAAWHWRDPLPVFAHPLSVVGKGLGKLARLIRGSR